MRFLIIVTACLLAGSLAISAPTNARNTTVTKVAASSLDELFKKLKNASNRAEANGISAQIWKLWFLQPNGAVQHLMARAQSARRAGLLKESITELDKIIELAPDYVEGWNQRATVNFMLGRNAESVRDIQQVLRIEPRHYGALAGLGLIHMRAKNWKSAIASFERALELHPFLGEKSFIPDLKKKLKGTEL
ncbi:MAG: tetratricopeptide (TPR) repeat protein [Hyphomicrobiaceae bacterium]|jgi:tetratricopeptide (TPR) repeat protein